MSYTNQQYAEMAHLANQQGKKLDIINKELILSDFPEPSFNEQKYQKLLEINSIYEEKAAKIKSDTPESEVLTWNIQQTEYEKWSIDNSSPTPFVDNLAQAREIEKTILIEKIGAKINAFKSYMAQLTGERQKFEDQIKSAKTPDELKSIIWKNA